MDETTPLGAPFGNSTRVSDRHRSRVRTVSVVVDRQQLLEVVGVRMLVRRVIGIRSSGEPVGIVRVIHARAEVRVVERLVLVAEPEIVRDFLARYEAAPRRGIVSGRVEVRVVQLGYAFDDMTAARPDLQRSPAIRCCRSEHYMPQSVRTVGRHAFGEVPPFTLTSSITADPFQSRIASSRYASHLLSTLSPVFMVEPPSWSPSDSCPTSDSQPGWPRTTLRRHTRQPRTGTEQFIHPASYLVAPLARGYCRHEGLPSQRQS